jgi:cytochrome c oxidase subunit 1
LTVIHPADRPDGRTPHGVSTLPFLWNVVRSYRYGRVVTVDDPWGFGRSLEWATSCPPPRHNFTELPRIRSERCGR